MDFEKQKVGDYSIPVVVEENEENLVRSRPMELGEYWVAPAALQTVAGE